MSYAKACLILALTTLTACSVPRGPAAKAFAPNPPDQAAANAFAKQFLNQIQAQSFAERREICGYFFTTAEGELRATPPVPGNTATCELNYPRQGSGIFASYHTHGAYDRFYDNEVPSPDDLISDFGVGLDGYVSTPGGRVWLVEFDDKQAYQLCGRGCVAVDPGFVPEGEADIQQTYTIEGLRARQ